MPNCRCICPGDLQCDSSSQYYDYNSCNCTCIPKLCPNNGTIKANTCEC